MNQNGSQSFIVNNSRKSRKKASRPKLPPYVVLKGTDWHVRVNVPTPTRDAKGRIIYEQITRKCEPKTAERAAEIVDWIRSELARTEVEVSPAASVNEFLTDYLALKEKSVEPRTHQLYEHLFNRFIKTSQFGPLALNTVETITVQRFYDTLGKGGVSAAMIKKIDILLSMAFRQAVRWDLMRKNACDGVMLPKQNPVETASMRKEEARRFSRAIRKDDRFIIFELALETALRPQEVIGLSWDAIDLSKRRLTVRQAVKQDLDGKNRRIGTTKTKASIRVIGFSEYLRDRLLRHREIQETELARLRANATAPLTTQKKTHGVNYNIRKIRRQVAKEALAEYEKHNLVFPAENGKPRSLQNLSRREFREALALAKLDVKKFSFKCLRHTCLSLLAEHLRPKKLQKLAGHSSYSTTHQYYLHIDDDDSRFESSDAMASALY